ncbi:MAG: hypothetical protein ACUZ8H_02725 [Candidatus Anammoxibacter sp.]
MILKTLGKCKWEDIEVGEVFAWDGCWHILIKINNESQRILSDDFYDNFDNQYDESFSFTNYKINDGLYKLPLSTQRLWRQDK